MLGTAIVRTGTAGDALPGRGAEQPTRSRSNEPWPASDLSARELPLQSWDEAGLEWQPHELMS